MMRLHHEFIFHEPGSGHQEEAAAVKVSSWWRRWHYSYIIGTARRRYRYSGHGFVFIGALGELYRCSGCSVERGSR